MRLCECHYDGDLIHTLKFSDRDLKIIMSGSEDAKILLWDRAKRARKDLDLSDISRFDFVVRMERDSS